MSATTAKASPPASLTRRSVSLGVEVRLAVDGDERALGGEANRRRLADARGRAGDERDLALEASCHDVLPRVGPCGQKMAMGFQGEPVAPGSRSGRPTTMNSKRPSSSQASASSSSWRLSEMHMPMAVSCSGVDRVGHALDVARHGLAVAVGQEGGDAALVHPGHGVDVQPGLSLAGRRVLVAPGAEREAPRVVAGAEDEDVALAEPHALGCLDRLELRAGHRLAGLEPVDPAVAGGIEQHAAADDARSRRRRCCPSPSRARSAVDAGLPL